MRFIRNFIVFEPMYVRSKWQPICRHQCPYSGGRSHFLKEKLTLWRHQSRHIAPTDIYHIPNEPQFYTLFIKYSVSCRNFQPFSRKSSIYEETPKNCSPTYIWPPWHTMPPPRNFNKKNRLIQPICGWFKQKNQGHLSKSCLT